MDRAKGRYFWRWAALALVFGSLAACEKLMVKEEPPPPPPPPPAVVEGIEELTEPVKIEMPDPDAAPEFVLDTRSQVALLCYHDFSTTNSSNDMKINVAKFREQMQTLMDNEIPVISLSQFLQWKRGEINIPDFSVLITIDDGWSDVYTLAYPVMKEFGYPFTLFLYTKYLNIGGRSLSFDEINEMIANGAEIGSHSISHLDLTNRQGLSEEGYREFLTRELQESRAILKGHFGESFLDVFSYPYGTYSQQIIDLGLQSGYELLVTVDGKKSSWNTPNAEVGRYIIHGNNDSNFKYALTYRGNTSLASGSNLLKEGKDGEPSTVTTWPANEQTIVDRLPVITVDLSKVEGLDPGSIEMTVSGFGRVPAEFDETTKQLTYKVQQRLRDRECCVRLMLKRSGQGEADTMAWTFFVDKVAHYLPDDSVEPAPAEPAVPEISVEKSGENAEAGS